MKWFWPIYVAIWAVGSLMILGLADGDQGPFAYAVQWTAACWFFALVLLAVFLALRSVNGDYISRDPADGYHTPEQWSRFEDTRLLKEQTRFLAEQNRLLAERNRLLARSRI